MQCHGRCALPAPHAQNINDSHLLWPHLRNQKFDRSDLNNPQCPKCLKNDGISGLVAVLKSKWLNLTNQFEGTSKPSNRHVNAWSPEWPVLIRQFAVKGTGLNITETASNLGD